MARIRILTATIIGIVVSLSSASPRDSQWAQVEDAMDRGLPRTAIALLDEIIPEALGDQAYAESTKAICLQIALEGWSESDYGKLIVQLETALAEAPEPMQPVMETVLALWYWEYLKQNRRKFVQRTQTAEPPGSDITTWDLARILDEVDSHFTVALSAAEQLQTIPIRQWEDLLERGTVREEYRPALYDFLAYEALSFYGSGEQVGALPQDTFEIMADSPIFAPVAEFLQWNPQTADADSAKFKAIRLYQNLLIFHQDDADKTAFIDADLHRLMFGHNLAVGPDKAALYQAALERFADQWEDHEVSARALYEYARVAHAEGDYVQARAFAKRGWEAYPASIGGPLCYNLIQRIEGRSGAIQTERVWSDPFPSIHVTYRNVSRVFFRVVPADFADFAWSPWSDTYKEHLHAALAAEPVLQWNVELPPTDDYQERTEILPAPEGLESGFYVLIASFKEDNGKVSTALIWISNLALIVRNFTEADGIEGLVLDATTGVPLGAATVTRWMYYSREEQYRPADQTQSDENGLFYFTHVNDQSFLLVAEYEGHMLATESILKVEKPENPPEQTVFFTDRSLYRPGQTIHYKGICIRTDSLLDDYRVLAGRQLTVAFKDVNGQEIARQSHGCNDYGAFSGSFTAPQDRLTGRMSIVVESGPSGSAFFGIEEYKRPQFRVEIEPPAVAPKLDAEIVVSGSATAYTGGAIGGAEFTWYVERHVRFPFWCWWAWRYPVFGRSQMIAHGTAMTEADGSFSISFTAKPDLSVPREDEPVFAFEVHVDVTDTTGETRSDTRMIDVGYTALQAAISADAWQTPDAPVRLVVLTQSLGGQPEPAAGMIEVYTLRQPEKVLRPELVSSDMEPDASDPNTWELDTRIHTEQFETDAEGEAVIRVILEAGVYRVLLQTQDRFGEPVMAQRMVHIVDPQATHFDLPMANHFAAPEWPVEPGEPFVAIWGTGYETGQAFVEVECRGEVLRAWWTDPGRTQETIAETVTENMRGGFTVRVTYVRENRAYVSERIVDVPWANKQLTLRWETFRSLLEPGQEEVWAVEIAGPDAQATIAEMVAAAYDASLDQYLPHDWVQSFSALRCETSRLQSRFENEAVSSRTLLFDWRMDYLDASFSYPHLPFDIRYPIFNYLYLWTPFSEINETYLSRNDTFLSWADDESSTASFVTPAPTIRVGAGLDLDLDQVSVRQNLGETAFFYPHLLTDEDGIVRIEFTVPEALTEWRFLGFAHDGVLRSGFLTDTAVTAKELMVQPNPPRFVREGDVIEFSVKVSNHSAARQMGTVRLTLADARTLESRDQALGNVTPDQEFDVPSKESRTYSWRVSIPEGCNWLTYKAVGATTRLSDGEEGYLPVLSRQILVAESLPLSVRGPQTKLFEFTRLLDSGQSSSLRHQSLTVQMVSQPAWYAVTALPYLMEYPYASSDQVFNRFYANALASYIANSDPKIRRIFDLWKATPALDSPLEKNEDLKAVALEETPWVRQAVAESQARKNVGILFDEDRLCDETSRALFKLRQMQLSSGLWPWFPGCPGNRYITLDIATGFGRIRHLGVGNVDVSCAVRAMEVLDKWMDGRYRWILKYAERNENHLTPTIALYLYGRSFFLTDKPVDSQYQAALNYWLNQARQYWLSLWCHSEAHLAIALKRFGDEQTAAAIMQSLRECSVTDEELGMFWTDAERSWWWYRAPIGTQALMIEAFDEVSGDAQAVEDCRVWLLKQKQTQGWRTTKATADAVYALLLRGGDLLSSDALVEVALGGEWIEPDQVEAGTGFYEERFIRQEIQPTMGEITVKKTDEGVSWGSVHWQYLEDMSKITPYEGTPLQLKKTLYTKEATAQGEVLYPVEGPLGVGDELVVRIELRVDRDMEYVHMKDQRGSGTEPVNVLSRYRFQEGLAYYESTHDTATHFFMDYLPKGVYVFEYSSRIQHRGIYQTGMASIQCTYAPEFSSHSESFELEVR